MMTSQITWEDDLQKPNHLLALGTFTVKRAEQGKWHNLNSRLEQQRHLAFPILFRS